MTPALIVTELVAIDSVRPDPHNARGHDGRNLDAIKASLSRFGQTKPIVVDADGIILAGNGTHRAAEALGWTSINATRVPLKGAEARAYSIADNRTNELSHWETTTLASQLDELRNLDGFDLAAVGYTTAEIDRVLEDLTASIAGGLDDLDQAGPPALATFELLVTLASETQLAEAVENLRDLGYPCKRVESKATKRKPRTSKPKR